ncbi:hypothetical protein KSC_061290 [Ktedonobacter sp. SOSP1-52]|nr:hypothetical protein KSC_061290 [Ktedonobacter sp. SOSP1-52]
MLGTTALTFRAVYLVASLVPVSLEATRPTKSVIKYKKQQEGQGICPDPLAYEKECLYGSKKVRGGDVYIDEIRGGKSLPEQDSNK